MVGVGFEERINLEVEVFKQKLQTQAARLDLGRKSQHFKEKLVLIVDKLGDVKEEIPTDGKNDLNRDEDQVDANNDLTFGDGAVEDDWRANHTKVLGWSFGWFTSFSVVYD